MEDEEEKQKKKTIEKTSTTNGKNLCSNAHKGNWEVFKSTDFECK